MLVLVLSSKINETRFTQKPVNRKHIGTILICFKDKPDTEGLQDKTTNLHHSLCETLKLRYLSSFLSGLNK